MTLTARDEGGNEGRSEPFAFRLPERVFTKPLAKALVEQRRNLALDAGARSQVIDRARCADARRRKNSRPRPASISGCARSSGRWCAPRATTTCAKSPARLWQMAVGIEDGNISDAQANLAQRRGGAAAGARARRQRRGAQEADGPIARGDGSLHAGDAGAAARTISSSRVRSTAIRACCASRTSRACSTGWKIWRAAAPRTPRASCCSSSQQMMENLQMASPDMNGDDNDDMMQQLDDLGDMIQEQQDLRDRTFRQGQDQRRRSGERAPPGKPGQEGPARPTGQQGQQGSSRATPSATCSRTSRRCATGSTSCSTT